MEDWGIRSEQPPSSKLAFAGSAPVMASPCPARPPLPLWPCTAPFPRSPGWPSGWSRLSFQRAEEEEELPIPSPAFPPGQMAGFSQAARPAPFLPGAEWREPPSPAQPAKQLHDMLHHVGPVRRSRHKSTSKSLCWHMRISCWEEPKEEIIRPRDADHCNGYRRLCCQPGVGRGTSEAGAL